LKLVYYNKDKNEFHKKNGEFQGNEITKEIDIYIKDFKNIDDSEDINVEEDETVDVVFDFPGEFETYTITPTVAAILIDIIKKE
jgi:hypothetical protein